MTDNNIEKLLYRPTDLVDAIEYIQRLDRILLKSASHPFFEYKYETCGRKAGLDSYDDRTKEGYLEIDFDRGSYQEDYTFAKRKENNGKD